MQHNIPQPEEWRDIPGYEGLYQVSSHGRVRSLDRVVPHARYGSQPIKGRVMVAHPNRDGYLHLSLAKEGKYEQVDVHRLVALAFLPRHKGKNQVRHLDGNPANNRVENLAWGGHSENMRDRRSHGTDRNAAKTECVNGHKFDRKNTRVTRDGHRSCRACARINQRNYRARVARKHIRKAA